MITVAFDFPGVTVAKYDEVCKAANVSQQNLPDGLIFHSATPTDTGLQVVDVWESPEQFEAFGARLMPAMQAAGMPESTPRIHPTHAVMGSGRIPSRA